MCCSIADPGRGEIAYSVFELLRGDERYDTAAYLELLARAAETLLAPFGIERKYLSDRWGMEKGSGRAGFRTAELLGQRVLPESPLDPGTF